MIKDIPSSEEFDSAAKAQFDFAWDIAISFQLTFEDAGAYARVDPEDAEAFWRSARQRILTSLIIAQQGVELAIKGKLVMKSPYLLISDNHSDWPKDKGGAGVSFSQFKTIAAQDLIAVHDTVYQEKFDSGFSKFFEKLRKLRNKAMHTVDAGLNVSVQDVIKILLEAHEYLYPNENWVETRRSFLEDSAAVNLFFDNDALNATVAKEFLAVFKFLTRAEITRFFKIDKTVRLYLCPECKYESEKYGDNFEPQYAVLRPNDPDSEKLYCFVCDSLHLVEREDCSKDDCKGNVISVEYNCCCTCGTDQ